MSMYKNTLRFYLFIILCLFFNVIYGQKTSNNTNALIPNDSVFNAEISELRKIKEYDKIISLYNNKILLGNNSDYYKFNSACYYALIGDTTEAVHRVMLTYPNIKEIITPEDIITNSDFNPLHTTQGWRNIIDMLIEDYLASDSLITNKELSVELWFMMIEDQRYRTWSRNCQKDSPKSQFYYPSKYSDYQNPDLRLARIKKIIKTYGWPGYTLVGKKAGTTAFYVIQHSGYKAIKKYLPLIKKAAFNNEIDKESYALMLDRYLVFSGKKQLYGTQIIGFDHILWPIEDEVNVNIRRRELGMKNIEEYVKYWNISYNYNPKNKDASVSEIMEGYGYTLKKIKGHYSIVKIKVEKK